MSNATTTEVCKTLKRAAIDGLRARKEATQ